MGNNGNTHWLAMGTISPFIVQRFLSQGAGLPASSRFLWWESTRKVGPGRNEDTGKVGKHPQSVSSMSGLFDICHPSFIIPIEGLQSKTKTNPSVQRLSGHYVVEIHGNPVGRMTTEAKHWVENFDKGLFFHMRTCPAAGLGGIETPILRIQIYN